MLNGNFIAKGVTGKVSHKWPDNTPSILDQTDFNIGLFDFGKATGDGSQYFNCGLIEMAGDLWLVTRRSRPMPTFRYGFNDIAAFKLNKENVPQFGIRVDIKKTFDKEHFEDPRVMWHNGSIWLSCCNFLIYPNGKWTGAHQVLCQLDNGWKCARRIDVGYGKNSTSLSSQGGNEKNWLWFSHENQLHMLYNSDPFELSVFDDKLKAQQTWKTEWPCNVWEFGHIRGGTPPIRVGDEYWTFFHSSQDWCNKLRRYFMGAIAFEANPPWRMTRITTEPILRGSKQDPWFPRKPLCVFPSGAVLRDGQWTVTGGVNDLASFWIEIPHQDLIEQMIELPCETAPAVAIEPVSSSALAEQDHKKELTTSGI